MVGKSEYDWSYWSYDDRNRTLVVEVQYETYDGDFGFASPQVVAEGVHPEIGEWMAHVLNEWEPSR